MMLRRDSWYSFSAAMCPTSTNVRTKISSHYKLTFRADVSTGKGFENGQLSGHNLVLDALHSRTTRQGSAPKLGQ